MNSHGGVGREFTAVPPRAARLTVAPPDDRFEQEAERVADRVVAGTAFPSSALAFSGQRQVQRQNDHTETEIVIEDEEDEDEELEESNEEVSWDLTPGPTGRPKLEAEVSASGRTVSVAVPETSGAPLEGSVRRLMERRIGHDFGRVRVHTDGAAAHSARALRAQAYTIGSDIYFARERYAPTSISGQRLIAHELAHVVQQTGGAAIDGSGTRVQRKPVRRGKKRRSPPKPPPPKEWKAGDCTSKKRVKCATGECKKCPPSGSRRVRSPYCKNETCTDSDAKDSQNFIWHISVNRAKQQFTEYWGTPGKTSRIGGPFLCSPELGDPSNGTYKIGVKCSLCHTNCDGDGMGWFTSFHKHLQYGFHNSQPVAKGIQSHGCVRVGSSWDCGPAKRINMNTTSGKTTVCIHDGDECGDPKPAPKKPPPKRESSPSTPSKPKAAPKVSELEGGAGERGRETLVEEVLT